MSTLVTILLAIVMQFAGHNIPRKKNILEQKNTTEEITKPCDSIALNLNKQITSSIKKRSNNQ